MHSIDRRRLLAALIAISALGGLGGCGSKPPRDTSPPPPGPPPELRISVSAASNSNGGVPVVVRLYELKARGTFDKADFFSVYDKESATLGPELIGREETVLPPGQERLVVRTLTPDSRYLGVVAAFRDIDSATWRAAIELRPGKNNNVAVTLGAKTVGIQGL